MSPDYLIMVSSQEGWVLGVTTNTETTKVAVAHYDGTKWARIADEASFPKLQRVSMVSEDEGWAVGDGSTMFHHKSGTWAIYP